jgi:single-stranded DNA-binding protein
METQASSRLIGPVYDMKLSQTKSGRDLLIFKLKTWRKSRSGDEKVCWFRIAAYEGNARVLTRHLHNGKILVVDGFMDLYKDDGVEKFQVIMERFFFLGKIDE